MATPDQRETFRRVIQTARGDLGLTQSALAARIGTTRTAVAKWETGEAAPSAGNTIQLLEEALELRPGRLSHILGHAWAPDESVPATSVVEAVEEDPHLDLADRRLLLDLYRRLRQGARQLAASPGG